MIFDVADDAYEQFMGRYAAPLAVAFCDFAGVPAGRVLDVGAGTGALTAELVSRAGAANVAAVEPSARFVEGLQRRFAAIDVREAPAEALPFAGGEFAAALCQLVLSFVADGPQAARELRRVVRPGGVVAACMWDRAGLQMIEALYEAGAAVAPQIPRGEHSMKYRDEASLRALFEGAGLRVETALLQVHARYVTFDELWASLNLRVGPSGNWAQSLPAEVRDGVRSELFRLVGKPAGSFTLSGRAWAVKARVP